ncbi:MULTISPECIES: hypothetical protein [unclassified Brevibacterium]|uniref:hypothetical protein n=1 Tax=unclassified Brevibacterium TaxID=2614124 RepID=UPI0008A1BD4A|nr:MULTISPECIES: hypothetical protein [unclassified Brevibacterium]OFL64355.1 hypothetical protein HMPREF2757_00040 [Brevibacterium sp. HMSC063G07]OFS26798.1 hypothetical protein HMPREF3162_04550 [Brevibacterium sp. HMSC07C04]
MSSPETQRPDRGASPQPPPAPSSEADSLHAALEAVLSADTPEAVKAAEALTDRIETILDARSS